MLGKTEGTRREWVTEDETVGWHYRLNGHEFEQTPGDSAFTIREAWRNAVHGVTKTRAQLSMGSQRLGPN